MTQNVSDLVLEGNAAVTLLQELLACDITIAQARCEACGPVRGVEALGPHVARPEAGGVVPAVRQDGRGLGVEGPDRSESERSSACPG